MTRLSLPLLAGVLILAGCSTAEPPAPPPRVAAAAPPPAAYVPPAPPPSSDWRDWPLTPGDWRYTAGVGASFGGGTSLVTLSCDPARRTVRLALGGGTGGQATLRTTSATRSLPLTVDATGAGASLAATDPLLDAIAFSRGRFVVEAGGQTLVLPVYAEIGRVIEDCRG